MVNQKKNAIPCNSDASKEVRNVLKYLSDIAGKGILTGQHTQTMEQAELAYIKEVTGKEPALCGFELLSYSPNINYETCDEDCLKEIAENKGTLTKALEFAEKKGLITFCWHWYSPIGGKDKSFYAKNTDFDASKAVIEGTNEYIALISDMDAMAERLKEFRDKKIPILWRPFHEADGNWFWWGVKGHETAMKLYRLMYERYTAIHRLDNLIWVWNSPAPAGYPGDDFVDIISRDLYPPAHKHTSLEKEYIELTKVTDAGKLTAIGEIGSMPDIPDMKNKKLLWSYYMTWSNDFGMSENYTKNTTLRANYDCSYAITLDKLPGLY